MLKAVGKGPSIVACNSCRYSADANTDKEGCRGGALLTQKLREVQAANPQYSGVEIQEMPCLFACKDYCTIHLRGAGKVGYVLGKFTPDTEAAKAILEYAAAYADSEFGQVPYSRWPDGVKGHFITRTPPEGYVCT